MSPPTNRAAYLTSKFAHPLTVSPAPYTPPGPNEIVVRNAALAINPLDYFKQDSGNLAFAWIKYPCIMGSDLAGTVVEAGPQVTRFKAGDRVLGHAVGMDQRSNKASEGAFQLYTILRTVLAAPIPESMSFESACVLPLGLSTAACGLFMKDYLALAHPSIAPTPTGQTLLVWGGSTSVGCNAIQLARAAGYEVLATASPRNHAYLKTLGAAEVFDYRSPTVVRDLVAAFRGKTTAGAIAIGNGSLKPCIDVIGTCKKGRKFVAQASVDMPASGLPKSMLDMVSVGLFMGYNNVSVAVKSRSKGVGVKFIWGSDLMVNEVGKAVYEDYLPAALAQGKYVAAPESLVVGKGLEYVQEAMEVSKKGVSAKKVVISL